MEYIWNIWIYPLVICYSLLLKMAIEIVDLPMKITGWWLHTFLFSISYMGCHPYHWRTPSFFQMVIAPPTRIQEDVPKIRWVFRCGLHFLPPRRISRWNCLTSGLEMDSCWASHWWPRIWTKLLPSGYLT